MYSNVDEMIIEKLLKSHKKVLIYGKGHHAESICQYLLARGIEIYSCFVDDQYFIENEVLYGDIKVNKKSDFENDYENYNIVVGFCNVDATKNFIFSMQSIDMQVYYFWNIGALYNWDEEYISKNEDKLRIVRKNLADQLSKETLDKLVQCNLNFDAKPILSVASSEQYFNELTYTECGEGIYIDAGAYNGDTVNKFILFSQKRYKHILAFEPEEKNMFQLKCNTQSYSNIEYIPKGLWHKNTVLKFQLNGSASSIVDEQGKNYDISVPVTTIDSTVGKLAKVTFIKMDIEGSELNALKGASKIIKRDMPKLAICCYHKENDIIELFEYISRFENEDTKYSFYLRHHSNNISETVLYAIPVIKKNI